MRSGALFPVFFAVGGLCNLHVENAVVKSFISKLSRDVKIDWKNPPTFETEPVTEPTAWQWRLRCEPIKFKVKKEVAQPVPRRPSKSTTDPSQPNITIYYTSYMEKSVVNLGDDDVTFSLEQSTTSIDSTTKGWQIGAQISAGTENVAIGISAGYSKSWTSGKYQTNAVSIHTTCKSGYDCRIETWTFHLKVSGSCRIRPIIVCGDEIDACGEFSSAPPDQILSFQQKHCTARRRKQTYKYEPCGMYTPILDQVGKPLTRLVRISERIASQVETDAVGKTLKAVVEEDGWYQLENGEWYDPEDDTYYGTKGDKWYSKPKMPKPDLSKFQKASLTRRDNVGHVRNRKEWGKPSIASKNHIEIVFLDELSI